MFQLHESKRFAIITPLGESLRKNHTDKTAKGFAIQLLQSIAQKYERKLIDISTRDIQRGKLPDGNKEIPVVHYGVLGVDSLGEYDVIVELAALFYHEKSIKDAVMTKFGEDVSDLKSQKREVDFYTSDGIVKARRYVYDNELIQMEIENTQKADVQQTEGRFIRDDSFHKTIYRFHGMNIESYPTRTYLSWEMFFRYEFGNLLEPEDSLSKKALEYWDGIKDNIRVDEKFSNRDLPPLIQLTKHHSDYLRSLTGLGFIELVSPGGKGRGNAAVYRRLN